MLAPSGQRREDRDRQEEGGPRIGAIPETDDARAQADGATAEAHGPGHAEVAALPGRDREVHAWTRRRSPPPPQTRHSGVVTGSVHRGIPCGRWRRSIGHLLQHGALMVC